MTGDSGVAEVVDRASRFAFLLAAVVVAMVWLVVAARADRAFLPGGCAVVHASSALVPARFALVRQAAVR